MRERIKSVQKLGWYLLVILTPLWVNVWGQQPFDLPKVIFVRTLTRWLVGLALVDYNLTPDSLRRDLQGNPLLVPVSLLVLAIAVTTATAVNWQLSLWGSYERGQGALTTRSYILLFLQATAQMQSLACVRHVIAAMVASSIPLIAVELSQSIRWTPLSFVSDARSPIYATRKKHCT